MIPESRVDDILEDIHNLSPDPKAIYRSQTFIQAFYEYTVSRENSLGRQWKKPRVTHGNERGVTFEWENIVKVKKLFITCSADDLYAELTWLPKRDDHTDYNWRDGMCVNLNSLLPAYECYRWLHGDIKGRPEDLSRYSPKIIRTEWVDYD